ncbi:MAG TPA: hypothetical protein VHP11_13530 [Tepidisphaeraceae bacterium]|nr:hypothetical protein [Tepidisphaeraceae bacterium]
MVPVRYPMIGLGLSLFTVFLCARMQQEFGPVLMGIGLLAAGNILYLLRYFIRG